MNERKGKGYVGKSMSVNAKNAYLDDEMPKSKWTKTAILQYLENEERDDLVAKAQELPLYVLREFLKDKGYHHTGKFYNTTRFYSFDIDWFDGASKERIEMIIAAHKAKTPTKTKAEREEEKQRKEARKEAKLAREELLKLYPYSKYKTEKGFLNNATPEMIEQLIQKRQEAIQAKREQLRETWTKQGYKYGLENIENDNTIEYYVLRHG